MEVRAYSFQTDLTFGQATSLLVSGLYGDWYERDSAWYDNLLSCRSYSGVRMNLYYFDDEKVIELKFTEADEGQVRSIERHVLETILPALQARDVETTESVD